MVPCCVVGAQTISSSVLFLLTMFFSVTAAHRPQSNSVQIHHMIQWKRLCRRAEIRLLPLVDRYHEDPSYCCLSLGLFAPSRCTHLSRAEHNQRWLNKLLLGPSVSSLFGMRLSWTSYREEPPVSQSRVHSVVPDYRYKLQSLTGQLCPDCVWHMWEPPSSCQHGNSLAVREWVWHGGSRATTPSLKRPQSNEMTSQQRRSRCHHWVLSLPLAHRILNPNWPTWPDTTNFIYLFKDVQLALKVQRLQSSSYSDTRRDLVVLLCVIILPLGD